jgi:hypothetical protein
MVAMLLKPSHKWTATCSGALRASHFCRNSSDGHRPPLQQKHLRDGFMELV